MKDPPANVTSPVGVRPGFRGAVLLAQCTRQSLVTGRSQAEPGNEATRQRGQCETACRAASGVPRGSTAGAVHEAEPREQGQSAGAVHEAEPREQGVPPGREIFFWNSV